MRAGKRRARPQLTSGSQGNGLAAAGSPGRHVSLCHPGVLTENEGFVIEGTVPATGTWTFTIKVDWEELAAY